MYAGQASDAVFPSYGKRSTAAESPHSSNTVVGFQIHLLLLHTAPQELDEDIIDLPALAVHADVDALPFENAYKLLARELVTLICVEDLRDIVGPRW